MIAIDTNFLVLLLDPGSAGATPADRAADRVRHFVEGAGNGVPFLIPSPAIAEFAAIKDPDGRTADLLALLGNRRTWIVQPFGIIEAIETGKLIRRALDGRPGGGVVTVSKPEMKYDAMIAATAIVHGASSLVTGDRGLAPYLKGSGVELIAVADLPLPPEPDQPDLGL